MKKNNSPQPRRKHFLVLAILFAVVLFSSFVSAAINVTLNSPADNQIYFSYTGLFNVSSNVIGFTNLTNSTLYTNSSGTFTNKSTLTYAPFVNNDDNTFTNVNYAFDSDDATYAQKTGAMNTALGKTFSNRQVSTVRIKATVTTSGSGSGYSGISLQWYNGTTWSQIVEFNHQSCVDSCSSSYDNTYSINLATYPTIQGLRLKSVSGWNADFKIYTLNFNSTITDVLNTTLVYGNNLWNIQDCDSTGSCIFATSNRTVNKANSTFNSFTYNSTSYETSYENYIANITSSTLLTTVKLDYNGTEYTMIQSGDLWSYSKSLTSSNIGNNSIRLKYTYDSNTIYSDYYYQYVNTTNINQCNGTYTTKYINFSFWDETTGLPVNSQISNLILNYKTSSSSTVYKTLTYTNTTEVPNYYFCAIPSNLTYYVNYSISYKNGTTYPQRISEISSTAFTNTTTNTKLYLLSSTYGIYVTFQLTNAADQLISGVDINATREINGVTTVVAIGTTSASGTVTFWLNPDALHTFSFAKSGYTTYSYSDYPTQASYTITLSGGGDVVPINYNKGILYTIYPVNTSLTNNTIYNFGLLLTSSYWDLEEYGFVLRFDNGTSITSATTSTSGTLLSLSYDTGNASNRVYLDYYWKINNTYSNGTASWRIYSTDNTRWSIKTFFTDLSAYMDSGIFGLDNFGRYLIIFLILFLSVGIMAYKFGMNNPLFLTGLLFFIVFFLDVAIGLIPDITILNGNQVPYLLTFITGLIFVVSIISEVSSR